MSKLEKSNQNPEDLQKMSYSGDLKSSVNLNCPGSETDQFGHNKILVKVCLNHSEIMEIERQKKLGNIGIQLILFESTGESTSRVDSQEATFDPVEHKTRIDFSLTESEKKFLEELDKGFTYMKIADNRFRSVHTIKRQASDAYGKLGVHNRVQATAKYREFIKIILIGYLNLELTLEIYWMTFF